MRIRYTITIEKALDTDVLFDDDELIEKLEENGVIGEPDDEDIKEAIRDLANDNPEHILPDSDDLIEAMTFVEISGERPTIEPEEDKA